MRRSACRGYGQPQSAMNYHSTHSEHVTKVAGNPCHAAGSHNNHALQQQAHRHHGYNSNNHGGASHRRYETYEETYEEKTTYRAGRHHGHGHGGGGARRYEYETYEETSYEEEQEVVGGGGCAQLKCGYRCSWASEQPARQQALGHPVDAGPYR
ncbi:hypothetical protein PAHAL_5G048400 [Panicum hallii]|jgi:hypothetical protein|uniref:Uncharacterized protein n=1 Tax=Panicum hallii TaxID=206008 RepID=A0A2S3HP18_9POAL|nr:hypothetical protein PAHAL_5G048400 [Panicum hallii]